MRIALLGVDDTTLAIAAAAVRDGHYQVVMVDGFGRRSNEAAVIAPKANLFTEWEILLNSPEIEGIVLAADEPALRVEQLKRLIQLQRGIAVLASHPLTISMLDGFELEMIREESASIVMPYLPARWHPAVAELHTFIQEADDSPIRVVEQITCQRSFLKRDRETVLRQFARDADLLQHLAGSTSQLHAFSTGTGSQHTGFAHDRASEIDLRDLVVQMTCERGILARWSVSPTTEQNGAVLTLVGSQGEAVLRMNGKLRPWRLEVRGLHESSAKEYPEWDAATTALERLSAAYQSTVEIAPTWSEACRTLELTEAIGRSLARGRTIDLHNEEFSDIGTFKGTMTSVGCGLLVVGLALVVVVALIHALAVQAGWAQLAGILDRWPYLLLAVCGIYLLLQPLVFIGQRKPTNRGAIDSPRK